jgi:hypothetical protein
VVESVTVTTVNRSRGAKAGQAVVVIKDDLGSPVASANVVGDFGGTFNEVGKTGTTNSDGSVTFTTNDSAKGGVTVTFCVTDVTGSLPYSGADVCGST